MVDAIHTQDQHREMKTAEQHDKVSFTCKNLRAAVLVMALWSSSGLFAGDQQAAFDLHTFTNAIDVEHSQSHYIEDRVPKVEEKNIPRMVTIYSWGNGAFWSESRLYTNGIISSNTLFAAGT